MANLKDLSKLGVSLSQKYQQLYMGDEVELPVEFKRQVSQIANDNISYYRYSAVVSTKLMLKIYLPNQWFYIASFFTPYYNELKKYKDYSLTVFDQKRLKALAAGQTITASEKNGLINKYGVEDADLIEKFVTDYKWWGGGKTIDRNDYYVSPILKYSKVVNVSQSYIADICAFLSDKNDLVNLLNDVLQQKKQSASQISLQQIFYGAPGTGKSFKIKECTQGDDTVIRTTFHPDSDYSTFVGCYKPTMEETNLLSLQKLHELYPEFKKTVANRPLQRFIMKHYSSFRKLTEKEAESVFDTIETPATITAEVPKVMAAIEELPKNSSITYSFVAQAFTKAYVQAWKKMCDTSLWTKKATAMPPTGIDATPYGRTGKIGGYHDFGYTSDKATLKDSEETALLEVDNFDFPFDGINNFGELHNQIKVIVTDEPNTEQKERYKKTITLTATQIRDLVRKYLDNRNIYGFLESLLSKILKKLGWSWHHDLDKLKDYTGNDITIEVEESYSLLGLYDPATKTVYLFKNNIGSDINLLCATYIHEMFHAYYDSGNRYIPEIEEPIVECNTLCFLELFDDKKTYLSSYKNSVERKQSCIVINFYGFGAHLYENRSLDWMRLYQNAFNQIDASSAIVNQYKSMFFPIYSFDDEDYTRNLLYNILNPQYDEISIPKQSRQYLIIEEINRGNCAQIFGDLFQLLDRKDGYSEYPIEADEDLRKELENEFVGLKLDAAVEQKINSIFEENYPDGITDKILNGELLVLPKNLFIWATMNTSDQSLFPIDSAFKRRWEWKYIPIKNHKDKSYTIDINGVKYDWWGFLTRINQVIGETTSSEDKKLGYFFAKAKGEIIDAEQFVGKVLFYIWNDVFKNYGFDNQIFSKGDKRKFEFSDFFKNDGTANEDAVNMFLRKLEETIKIEGLPLEIKEESEPIKTEE